MTAVADGRASAQLPSGQWRNESDLTAKLFRLRINCYKVDSILLQQLRSWLSDEPPNALASTSGNLPIIYDVLVYLEA